MKKIALEEAFSVEGIDQLTPALRSLREFSQNRDKLVDLAGERLRAMDEGDVELSVLSATSPGLQGIVDADLEAGLARQWNDYLAEAVSRNPGRLRGFAALPMRDPQAAAGELTRAVHDLGLVGALINGYDNSGENEPVYFDAPRYLDFWRTAAALDVPVYVHPRTADSRRVTTYDGYPELRGAAWGFHVETAEHVLRMILAGVFDAVPDLTILLGHMGELLPFWAWRIDHRILREGWDAWAAENGRPRRRTVTEYLRTNVYITTSGIFDTPSLNHALDVVGPERILYSVDYPYESTTEANDWFESLGIDQAHKNLIGYENAKRVLKLNLRIRATLESSFASRGQGDAAEGAQLSFHCAMPPFTFTTFMPLLRAAVFSAAGRSSSSLASSSMPSNECLASCATPSRLRRRCDSTVALVS